MKSQNWLLFKALIPVFVGIALVAVGFYNYIHPLGAMAQTIPLKPKLGVDLAGGTTLIYEVDSTEALKEGYTPERMVQALKRRIDPSNILEIKIRHVGNNRFEITIPTGGQRQADAEAEVWKTVTDKAKQDYPKVPAAEIDGVDRLNLGQLVSVVNNYTDKSVEEIEKNLKPLLGNTKSKSLTSTQVNRIRGLITQVGKLEFRILANSTDDSQAFKDADLFFFNVRKAWYGELNDANERERGFIPDFKAEWKNRTKKDLPAGVNLESVQMGDFDALTSLILKQTPEKDREETRKQIQEVLRRTWRPDKAGNEQLREFVSALKKGAPPPPPVKQATGSDEYTINLHDKDYQVTYAWVEIGKEALNNMRLSNKFEPKDKAKPDEESVFWMTLAASRAAGETHTMGGQGGRKLFSWEMPDSVRKTLDLDGEDKGKKFQYFILTRNPLKDQRVTGEDLVRATRDQDQSGRPAVNFGLNSQGAKRFSDLTTRNGPNKSGGEDAWKRQLAVVLDGYVQQMADLKEPITSGSGQISGMSSVEEADKLVTILRSGALPATLKRNPVSTNEIPPELGEETINAGAISISLAFVFVLLFMVYYYHLAGLVACVALLANLVLTVAFMMLVNAPFTLAGLAGLVLMLAMAVDANVLIYERIREERDRGASLQLAIRNGYDRAFPTIIDTHLSSIFTAVVLYVVGNEQLKGFGISLTVGLLISLYTALYVTRVIFDWMVAKNVVSKLSMTRWLQKTNINFMSIRKQWFTITVLFTLFGITAFLWRGEQGLNIDFVGGTEYEAALKTPQTMNEIEQRLVEDKAHRDQRLALEKADSVGKTTKRLFFKGDPKDSKGVIVRFSRDLSIDEIQKQVSSFEIESLRPTKAEGDKIKQIRVETPEKEGELARVLIHRLFGDWEEENGFAEKGGFTVTSVQLQLSAPKKTKDVRDMIGPALKDLIQEGTDFKLVATGGDSGNERTTTMSLELPEPVSGLQITEKLGGLVDAEDPNKLAKFEIKQFVLNLKQPADLSVVEEDLKTVFTIEGNEVLKGITDQLTVEPETGATPNKDRKYAKIQVTLPLEADGNKVVSALTDYESRLKNLPPPYSLRTVDKLLAADMQQRALLAIALSWMAMLLYLWFRFGNWTFGLAAVFCLVHDLCFTLGLIAFSHYVYNNPIGSALGLEDFKIDFTVVAALLTLIGFSVNDTIVVFDRIREVRGKNPALTAEMINQSINQTLSRTVLTSLIAFLVVFVLYVFGGSGIHPFSFVMVVGVIVGTYSSVFVACPLLLWFGEGKTATSTVTTTKPTEKAPAT